MDNKYCLEYLKQLLKILACDSFEQQQMIPQEVRCNISSDIANEWDYENIEFFIKNLLDKKFISKNIQEGFQTICNNFEKVSINGTQFDPTIWSTEGFEYHPFWEHQRKLAKQLLNELDKVQL